MCFNLYIIGGRKSRDTVPYKLTAYFDSEDENALAALEVLVVGQRQRQEPPSCLHCPVYGGGGVIVRQFSVN